MKYMIKRLESFSIDFLVANLSVVNIFTVLQFCIDCKVDERLTDHCRLFLRNNTEDILKHECFLKISHECLAFFLQDDGLTAAEIHLFQAVCIFLI